MTSKHGLCSQLIDVNDTEFLSSPFNILCFPFIEMDDNFGAPGLMDDDNAVDDCNDNDDDDDGNNVAEEEEVKWSKIII